MKHFPHIDLARRFMLAALRQRNLSHVGADVPESHPGSPHTDSFCDGDCEACDNEETLRTLGHKLVDALEAFDPELPARRAELGRHEVAARFGVARDSEEFKVRFPHLFW